MSSNVSSPVSSPSTASVTPGSSKSVERGISSYMPNLASNPTTAAKGAERAEMTPRSFSDPAVVAPANFNLSHSNNELYRSSTTVSGSAGNRNSRQSFAAEPIDEEKKVLAKKRHSGSNRANVHTECGRHTDDWLVGPFIDTVKGAVRTITGGKPR